MAIESGLTDIIPPVAPPVNELLWLWWIVPILLLLLVYLYYRARPRNIMRRKLRRLHRQLKEDSVACKSASFQIACSLRQAYGTPRLDSLHFGASRQLQWHDFVTRLQQLQYQATAPGREELNGLLLEAIDWL